MNESLRFAAVQIAASELADHEGTLRRSLDLIEQAAAQGAELVALPECTYPGYFLHSAQEPARLGVLKGVEAVAVYARKAAELGVYLAVGMAYIEDDGSISNSAVLIDDEGVVVGRYAKSLLWHFDDRWFRCGREYPVFDTKLGRIGMFICADGRQPEIARAMALQEPDLLVDLTAWVSWGHDRAKLSSPQPDHLIPVRAMENGVWIAAAGKVGEEAGSILYCGSSGLTSPSGEVVARGSSDREEILVWDVPLSPARPYVSRRPELYGELVVPTEDLPIYPLLSKELPVNDAVMVSATQWQPYRDSADMVERVKRLVTVGRAQEVKLFVVTPPDTSRAGDFDSEQLLSALLRIPEADEVLVVTLAEKTEDGGFQRTMLALGRAGVLARHRQTHLGRPNADTIAGDQPSPIVETAAGRLAFMLGAEGYVPEVARCLMLRGAEVIAWGTFEPSLPALPFAQARAEENRVFVVTASTCGPRAGASVVEPTGRPLATAPPDSEIAVSSLINTTLARWKTRAPGTDVVLSRQPETYGSLTEKSVDVRPQPALRQDSAQMVPAPSR